MFIKYSVQTKTNACIMGLFPEPTVDRGRSRISVAKGSSLNFRGRKSNSLMNLCGKNRRPITKQTEKKIIMKTKNGLCVRSKLENSWKRKRRRKVVKYMCNNKKNAYSGGWWFGFCFGYGFLLFTLLARVFYEIKYKYT